MNRSVDDILAEALRLPREARADLARKLLASLHGADEVEEPWIDDAVRRDGELGSGTAQAYPADEVLARARARPGDLRAARERSTD